MSKLPTYFPDGYTRKGFIKAVEHHHGPMSFEYRPMLPDERDDVLHAVRNKSPGQYNTVIRSVLAKQVLSWDVVDPKSGQPVAIDLNSVKRLPPDLYDKLFNIVNGVTPSDPVEEDDSDETEGYVAGLLRQDGQAERDLGNSSAG